MQALRLRASRCGRTLPASLPAGEVSWTQALLWVERLHRASSPKAISAGATHSAFVDASGTMLTCGCIYTEPRLGSRGMTATGLLGHGSDVDRLSMPTPVPSLLSVRIHAVSAGSSHTLALSEQAGGGEEHGGRCERGNQPCRAGGAGSGRYHRAGADVRMVQRDVRFAGDKFCPV